MKNLLIAIACFAIGFLALILIESCVDPLRKGGLIRCNARNSLPVESRL